MCYQGPLIQPVGGLWILRLSFLFFFLVFVKRVVMSSLTAFPPTRLPCRRWKVIVVLEGFLCVSYYTLRLDHCRLYEEQIYVWVDKDLGSSWVMSFVRQRRYRRPKGAFSDYSAANS